MFKRIMQLCLSTAMLFSIQADPILYMFEGTISGDLGTRDLVYKLIVDFDEPGLIADEPIDDNDFYDYGSAEFEISSDVYFLPNELVYGQTASAVRYEFYGDYENKIIMEKEDSDPETDNFLKYFSLKNQLSTPFQLNDQFVVNEIYFFGFNENEYYTATGTVQLTSISTYTPESSVPEANIIIMLVLSLFLISSAKLQERRRL